MHHITINCTLFSSIYCLTLLSYIQFILPFGKKLSPIPSGLMEDLPFLNQTVSICLITNTPIYVRCIIRFMFRKRETLPCSDSHHKASKFLWFLVDETRGSCYLNHKNLTQKKLFLFLFVCFFVVCFFFLFFFYKK